MSQFWVVVADRSKARFYQGVSPLGRLEEFETLENNEARQQGQDIVTDRPGRRSDAGSRGQNQGGAGGAQSSHHRSGMPEIEDPREPAFKAFAREVADRLETGRTGGGFDKLTIVAEPQFLGLLRNEMTSATEKLVLEEISKNMTDADIDTIKEQFEQLA